MEIGNNFFSKGKGEFEKIRLRDVLDKLWYGLGRGKILPGEVRARMIEIKDMFLKLRHVWLDTFMMVNTDPAASSSFKFKKRFAIIRKVNNIDLTSVNIFWQFLPVLCGKVGCALSKLFP